jgi:hypothetical protein
MSQQPSSSEPSVAIPPVWSALPSDLQQCAVRLLTQLAFAHFRQHPSSSTQEIDHDHATQPLQDSPRPS